MHSSSYQLVVGLEVHARLLLNTKLFSYDAFSYGQAPNSQTSPVILAHPGTLPKLNNKAIEYAVKAGLALQCHIQPVSYFARKNYFYPDLPKAYQITQHTHPICVGGALTIQTPLGEKTVHLNRIHIEEDAGKSIHDIYDNHTCIDLNRAGTALLEIVTEPCIHHSVEAFEYLTQLKKIVEWIGVCDGNMEEGSLRCDANISIRPTGSQTLGTKVEVKNLNSIKNVKRAIEIEKERLINLLEQNQPIVQETRSYDADKDITFSLREKENANDYRYFIDPDLPPVLVSGAFLQQVKQQMPALPAQIEQQLVQQYQLSLYDAQQICTHIGLVHLFFDTAALNNQYKAIANWIIGPLKQYANDTNTTINPLVVNPHYLSQLVELVQSNQVSFSLAASKILPLVIQQNTAPANVAQQLNLFQSSNQAELIQWIDEVLQKMPDKVNEYKKGKTGLIGLFVGEVKKVSKGKADPKLSTQLITEKLKS